MKSKIKIYSFSALILALLLTVLRALSLILFYDHELGYFDGGFLPVFSRALTLAATLWCLTALILIPKDSITAQKSNSPLGAGALAACSILLLTSAVFLVLFGNKLSLVCGCLLLLGGLYPVCRLLAPDRISVCAGMILVVALVPILFIFHFDMYAPINGAVKNTVFLSILSGALMLLGELRFLFRDGMPRAFFALKLITPILCLPTAVGNLFLYFSDKTPVMTKEILTPFFSLVLLSLALYAAFGALRTTEISTEEKEIEEISKNT